MKDQFVFNFVLTSYISDFLLVCIRWWKHSEQWRHSKPFQLLWFQIKEFEWIFLQHCEQHHSSRELLLYICWCRLWFRWYGSFLTRYGKARIWWNRKKYQFMVAVALSFLTYRISEFSIPSAALFEGQMIEFRRRERVTLKKTWEDVRSPFTEGAWQVILWDLLFCWFFALSLHSCFPWFLHGNREVQIMFKAHEARGDATEKRSWLIWVESMTLSQRMNS